MILSSEVLKVTCRLSAAGPSFVRVTHGERNRDIMQMNTHSLKLSLSTIKRKIRDCLYFSTVAAYSFWSENVNVSNLILGHPLFSPFMHQSIPAAPSTPARLPRAEPWALTFLFGLDGKFPGVETLELSNLPGWGREKRANAPSSINTTTFFIDCTVE